MRAQWWITVTALLVLLTACDGSGSELDLDGNGAGDADPALTAVHDSVVGESFAVGTVAVTILEVDTEYEPSPQYADPAGSGFGVRVQVELVSQGSDPGWRVGPKLSLVDQDDVELSADFGTDAAPDGLPEMAALLEARSQERDWEALDTTYEAWLLHIVPEGTSSIALRVDDRYGSRESTEVPLVGDGSRSPEATLGTASVGRQLTGGPYTLMILDIEDPASPDGAGAPNGGSRFIGIKLEIVGEPDPSYLEPVVSLRKQDRGFSALPGGTFTDVLDLMGPGESREGWIYFEVPRRDVPDRLVLMTKHPERFAESVELELD
jgi:hypothetical protein